MNFKDKEAAVGYLQRTRTEVQEFGPLKVGDRVKHINQLWPEADRDGTGVIERMFHKPDSHWEQVYGRPDVELVFKRDDGSYSVLADYQVRLAEIQP